MAHAPHNNSFPGEPLDESPVIDPEFVYQVDPEINFDNIKPTPEAETPQQAAQKAKSILERLRDTRPETAAQEERPPAETGADPAQCPRCAESERLRLLALADLENARKRLAREKEDYLKFAGESIIADILPALDNLDLALAYAPESPECKNFVIGVDITRKLLLDALAKHGLEAIGELGETFDPARHEAVEMQDAPGYEPGQVCGLMNKGYRLKDRLIRPARVKVCKRDE